VKAYSLLALVLLAGACSGARTIAQGEAAFRRGDFEGAARAYEEVARARPHDPGVARALRSARRAAGLARARESFLAGDPDGALALLDPLAKEDPGDGLLAAWRAKVRRFVADTYVDKGRDALAGEDLGVARLAFERALEYYPGHESATAALDGLARETARRGSLSQTYYLSGMRALGEDRLEESQAGFQKSRKYDPEHRRAELRGREVARRLAAGRLAAAESFARAGRFAAAEREAALACALDPGLAAARSLRQEMGREVEVAILASRADLELARGDAAAARSTLERAVARTGREGVREALVERLRRLAEGELEDLYLEALSLEAERRIEPSVDKYAELLSRTPHYRDAIARLDNLKALLGRVEDLYRQAVSAAEGGNLPEARSKLEEVANLYPDYRDVAERRAALGGTESAPAPAPSPAERGPR
jgi:tetratricopeptide (TPR) repeat protein